MTISMPARFKRTATPVARSPAPFISTSIKYQMCIRDRLKGAVFTLYKDDSVIKEVTTDNAGVALFTGLKSGSYYIKETAAPEGYKLSDKKFDFTIDSNGVLSGKGFAGDELYKLTVENRPVEHGFQVKKVSANDEGRTLPGAEFRILGGGLDSTYTCLLYTSLAVYRGKRTTTRHTAS